MMGEGMNVVEQVTARMDETLRQCNDIVAKAFCESLLLPVEEAIQRENEALAKLLP